MVTTTVQIVPGWRGVDYSFARPDPALMAAAGITFVCRYESGGTSGKNVHTDEVVKLWAAGIAMILNWEQSAGDALQGAALGATQGATAKAHAEAIAYPHELPIVCSVDTGVTPWTIGLVEGYLRAFAKAIAPYPLGVYGGTTIINRVADICVLGWQANASSWSPLPSLNVHVRQFAQAADHQTDADVCIRPFKAWLPHPDPTPPTTRSPIDLGAHRMIQYVYDSTSVGSALVTFLSDGTYTMRGFNSPAERDSFAKLLAVVGLTDDAYNAWVAGSKH